MEGIGIINNLAPACTMSYYLNIAGMFMKMVDNSMHALLMRRMDIDKYLYWQVVLYLVSKVLVKVTLVKLRTYIELATCFPHCKFV